MDDNRKFNQNWQNENQEDGNGEEQLQRGKFSKLKWKSGDGVEGVKRKSFADGRRNGNA